MRPKPIIIFEILYCIMMSVGAWRSWMWLGDLNPTLPKTMLLATEIGMFLLVVSLVFFVSRRRSKMAMWILILLTLLPLLITLKMLFDGLLLTDPSLILLLQTTVKMIAILFLFLPSSRLWMSNTNDENDLEETFS